MIKDLTFKSTSKIAKRNSTTSIGYPVIKIIGSNIKDHLPALA